MLKKMALVLLSLNLLMFKPVIAEPITICVCVVGGGVVGWWWGSSGTAEAQSARLKAEAATKQAESERTTALNAKAQVEYDNTKKDHEIKKLRAELDERIRQAKENYQLCLLDNKRNANLGSSNISHACEVYEKELQSLWKKSHD